MAEPVTSAPPAGWYKNPSDPAQKRYWDGARWTDEVKPLASNKPPPGWFVDPRNAGQQRYWDGGRWTDQIRQIPSAIESKPVATLTGGEKAKKWGKAVAKGGLVGVGAQIRKDRREAPGGPPESQVSEPEPGSVSEPMDAVDSVKMAVTEPEATPVLNIGKGSRQQRSQDVLVPTSAASEIPGADQQLISKLKPRVRQALKENLMAGEQVRVIVPGAGGQAIVGTETRAFVCKPGWRAGATLGMEMTTWNYKQIVGIQVHKGKISGAVAIQAPGQTGSNMSVMGQKNDDPFKAPNAIPIISNDWAVVNSNVAELRRLIAAHQDGGASVSPTSQSPLDQIRQLGDLRDAGVLSEPEFESKKKELLGRL